MHCMLTICQQRLPNFGGCELLLLSVLKLSIVLVPNSSYICYVV